MFYTWNKTCSETRPLIFNSMFQILNPSKIKSNATAFNMNFAISLYDDYLLKLQYENINTGEVKMAVVMVYLCFLLNFNIRERLTKISTTKT